MKQDGNFPDGSRRIETLKFCLDILHNAGIMITNDTALIKWAEKGQRQGVSLGQLVTLLELSGRESVASMAPESVSHAVNYRQKLDRLEKALGIGRLTRRVGNVTQASELGQRVAGEVRLLLMELTRKSANASDQTPWIFGAGDTWLQSIVIPTLARWPSSGVVKRWQVANLRTHDLCDALREGRVHFGLVRTDDLKTETGLDKVRVYPGVGQCVIMSGAPKHGTAREAIQWAIAERHPLIQQGSSWVPYRAVIAEVMSPDVVEKLEPSVVCETHPQAAGSVVNGRGWAVVPSIVARNVERAGVELWEVSPRKTTDEVALVVCGRVLDKLGGGAEAANALKQEIGLTMSGAKK
jgi:DNA-binding transcriptional LysR family regulator